MASPWSDLDRPPLSARRLQRVVTADSLWREVRVLTRTSSTNADVVAAAREGAQEGLVVIAEEQTAGRGRMGRAWSAPARSSVLLSWLLRPTAPIAAWPLLPLMAGLALAETVAGVGEVPDVRLKWPNDVLVDDKKLAGILTERTDAGGAAVVVGLGLNVSLRAAELPVDTATSLALVGGATDREILVKELLRSFARRYATWCDDDGAPASVLPAYREWCETIGRAVSVQLPGGDRVEGVATAVDDTGRLLVRTDAGEERAWSAGDVTHVRAGA
ncbi:MAG TPA: biotin--[acetyl-CoA-carboxylase] ligase [Mycobacteriales bacterium]|nr:biotin--[acetyl-CoA-carboxylase] ligase [Mycobacteriales bacterium]